MTALDWSSITLAADRTHHLLRGQPLYDVRFDEVLKFHAPGLAPVRRGDHAWHIEASGHAAYDQRFRRSFGFYDGVAAVAGDDGWRHIRPNGTDLYVERYAWCGNFQLARCPVRTADRLYFHIDVEGQPLYAERWRYAGDYRDDIAVVQRDDGLSTHVDGKGRLLHDVWFRDLDVYHKGYARACDESGWMHVDERGRPIYARRFAMVEPFYNGQARVETIDGALEVVNEDGSTLLQLRTPQLNATPPHDSTSMPDCPRTVSGGVP